MKPDVCEAGTKFILEVVMDWQSGNLKLSLLWTHFGIAPNLALSQHLIDNAVISKLGVATHLLMAT